MDRIKLYKKKVLSKAWAKKYCERFRELITTSGDRIGLREEGKNAISKNGLVNLYKKYIQVAMDDVGANIGVQAWDCMTEEDILKLASNIREEVLGARLLYDGIECGKLNVDTSSQFKLKGD